MEDRTQPLEDSAPPRASFDVLLRPLDPKDGGPVRLRDRCVVGSGEAADLRIVDRTVSRLHAELTLSAEGVLVRDLGSRNGSFYLDQRIESIVLSVGAAVRFGRSVIALEVDQASLEDSQLYPNSEYRGLVGSAPAMRRLFGMLSKLEHTRVTTLVEGESGVGKELVARALHAGSDVAQGPFVAVNCGALPRELLSSELFGHRRGAFTGAHQARRGAFESADSGTLFLDEIGELPIDAQPALLRALETGEVRPLGGDAAKQLRVRVIAATNRDLRAAIEAGAFREDLYYRLAVVRVKIPPLRERLEDLEPLANHFAGEAGLERLPSEVIERLKRRPLRGNVRELRNAVSAYVALGALPEEESPRRLALDLTLSDMVELSRPYAEQKDELVERFTRLYLSELLAQTRGNHSEAARLAGLDRGHLRRLAQRYVKGQSEDDD